MSLQQICFNFEADLLFAVDIAYGAYKNPMLLDVAQKLSHFPHTLSQIVEWPFIMCKMDVEVNCFSLFILMLFTKKQFYNKKPKYMEAQNETHI